MLKRISPIIKIDGKFIMINANDGDKKENWPENYYGLFLPDDFDDIIPADEDAGVSVVIGKSNTGKTAFVHKNFRNCLYLILDETTTKNDLMVKYPNSGIEYIYVSNYSHLYTIVAKEINNQLDGTGIKRKMIVDSSSLFSREGDKPDTAHITLDWLKSLVTTSLACRRSNANLLFILNAVAEKEIVINELLEKADYATVTVYDLGSRRYTRRFNVSRGWQAIPFDMLQDYSETPIQVRGGLKNQQDSEKLIVQESLGNTFSRQKRVNSSDSKTGDQTSLSKSVELYADRLKY